MISIPAAILCAVLSICIVVVGAWVTISSRIAIVETRQTMIDEQVKEIKQKTQKHDQAIADLFTKVMEEVHEIKLLIQKHSLDG
jgi:hypothetical protein